MEHIKKLLEQLDHYRYHNYDRDEITRIERELDDIRQSSKQDHGAADDVFVPYPALTDPKFYEKLYKKKEFNKYKYPAFVKDADVTYDQLANNLCGARNFRLTNQQMFVKNFISPHTPYNGLLLFNGVGVGKSCSALSIAEQFRDVFSKRVLVLMPTNLKDNFKKQIFDITRLNQCTSAKYFSEVTDGASTLADSSLKEELIQKNVNKLINERYQFMGFHEFANQVQKWQQGSSVVRWSSRIRDFYSNRVIIVDEVHNVREGEGGGTGKLVPPRLMDVLKHAENVKLVLLSATPMFNEASEIVWLANLLLANDKRPLLEYSSLFDKKGVLQPNGLNVLQQSLRGYVSYMRGENPFSFPMRLYPSVNGDKNLMTHADIPKTDIKMLPIIKSDRLSGALEIVKSTMSKKQAKVYEHFEANFTGEVDSDTESNDDEDENENEEDVDHSKRRIGNTTIVQISNIIYPYDDVDNAYGKKGFKRCFDEHTNPYKVSYKKSIIDKYGKFLHPKSIAKWAPKMKAILDYIENSEGIVYVYSFYMYSGIIPLAIALEHMGYNKYKGNNLLKSDSGSGSGSGGATKQKRNLTYCMITPKTNTDLTPDFEGEIEAIRSAANKNGDIIKVVLGSSVSAEGIDFKCIREIHMLEPWYHLNKVEQIVGRAVRNCSHIDLPSSQRNVTMYHHANLVNERNAETIDLRSYRIAENKQRVIDQVEDVLKRVSVDCNLNKNTLYYDPSDVNMSIKITTSQGTVKNMPVGDIRIKPVKCIATMPAKIKVDDSTFKQSFYTDDIELYAKYIRQEYVAHHRFTYHELLIKLKATYKLIDEDVLKFALEFMMNTRYNLMNEKGVSGFILYRGQEYIFQPSGTNDLRIPVHDRKGYSHPRRDRILVHVDDAIDASNASNALNALNATNDTIDTNDSNATNDTNDSNDSKKTKKSMKVTADKDIDKRIAEMDKFMHLHNLSSSTERSSAAIDFVVDRLSQVELYVLIKTVKDVDIKTSLVDGGILYVDLPDWFFNPYTMRWCVIKTGVPVAESDLVPKYGNGTMQEYHAQFKNPKYPTEKLTENLKKQLKAHFTVNEVTTELKLIRPGVKGWGSGCSKTSTFTVDVMNGLCQEIGHTTSETGKRTLCDVYELLLRTDKKKVLLGRPVPMFFLQKFFKEEEEGQSAKVKTKTVKTKAAKTVIASGKATAKKLKK